MKIQLFSTLSLKNTSILVFVSQALAYGLFYLTSFFLVRMISKHNFGVFQQFNLLVTTVLPLVGFTLVSSLYYFYPITDDKFKKQYVVQTYILLLFSAVILSIILMLFNRNILEIFNFKELYAIDTILFLSIGFFLVSTLTDNIFILEKKNLLILLFSPIEKLIYLASIILYVSYLKTFEGAIIGYFIYTILKFIFVSVYIYKNYLSDYDLNFDLDTIKKQFNYCLPFFIANIVFVFAAKFDKLLLNQFISPEEYAVYTVAFLSIPLLANVFASINNVVIPEMTALIQRKEFVNVIKLYNKVVISTSSIAIPAVILFFILAEEIILLLFTEQYLRAVSYYRVYIIIFLFTMSSYGLILRASSLTKKIFYSNIIGAILTIITGLILIPSYKTFGAIITATLAIIIPISIQLFFEIRFLETKFIQFVPVKQLLYISIIAITASFLIIIIKSFDFAAITTISLSLVSYVPVILFFQYKFNLTPFSDIIKAAIKKFK